MTAGAAIEPRGVRTECADLSPCDETGEMSFHTRKSVKRMARSLKKELSNQGADLSSLSYCQILDTVSRTLTGLAYDQLGKGETPGVSSAAHAGETGESVVAIVKAGQNLILAQDGVWVDSLKSHQADKGASFDANAFEAIARIHCQAEGIREVNRLSLPAMLHLMERRSEQDLVDMAHSLGAFEHSSPFIWLNWAFQRPIGFHGIRCAETQAVLDVVSVREVRPHNMPKDQPMGSAWQRQSAPFFAMQIAGEAQPVHFSMNDLAESYWLGPSTVSVTAMNARRYQVELNY